MNRSKAKDPATPELLVTHKNLSTQTQKQHNQKSLRTRQSQRGFSLLEVLVAFAILALSLGVLMQIFSRAMNTTAFSANYSRAVALAEAKLGSVGADIPLEQGAYSGEPEDGLDWVVNIQPYPLPEAFTDSPVAQPYAVTAIASWPSPTGARRVVLRSIRLGAPL
ncbi:prepilin-type N-terminal cleavage/methylation domain-containing protein [Thiohalocapsa marina]|uniref:Prepilin-type N-terminal cleavage/methylation domain-containing protein n=1 Tax=Thiohalocapsa marina TaxID=424902 RepID=A0A5M8FU19_9GAMM|nr:prepilin-type N-terminal cleavage/methylation domain-containing protein [Thiohalocapsa marina]KAA6187286.1 prepilin-type N-terminal cleavage/methylation domain-containing protein [Thiohalocapsa marina]